MFFKKIAMLLLTVGIASGVMMCPVAADAKENQNTASERQVETSDGATEEKESNSDPKEIEKNVSPSPVVTKAPAATPKGKKVVSSVKKTTTTKAKKKNKTSKTKKYKKSELRLMASIINCEAGGESFQGKLAVGIVVMNRVKSKAFPNTIRKVIYQRGQFSPVRNGSLRRRLKQYDAGRVRSAQWKSCIKAAKKVLQGQRTIKLRGKTKSMKGVRFFSVGLSGAKFRLGGHRFK